MRAFNVSMLTFCALPVLAGCAQSAVQQEPILLEKLVFYDWAADSIEEIFDDFTQEYGIEIDYVTFDSTEEAVANIRDGQNYDIVIIENQHVLSLVAEGLLAEIDPANVPNTKNISPSFRDLSYDPGNRFSIPYSWGTTGLVVRTDLTEDPVTSWSDMWDPRYAGQVANWLTTPRFTIGAALLSLGYSVNSEDASELEEALQWLLQIKDDTIWLDDEPTAAPLLVNGDAVMALGWSEDFWLAQEGSDDIEYVLPSEGTILWGDNYVIPANSENKYAAELFLDFVLRPEISAELVNSGYYPLPNDAAIPLIDPEILADPAVYPTNEQMRNAQFLLPLSAAGEQLHADVWTRFMASNP